MTRAECIELTASLLVGFLTPVTTDALAEGSPFRFCVRPECDHPWCIMARQYLESLRKALALPAEPEGWR